MRQVGHQVIRGDPLYWPWVVAKRFVKRRTGVSVALMDLYMVAGRINGQEETIAVSVPQIEAVFLSSLGMADLIADCESEEESKAAVEDVLLHELSHAVHHLQGAKGAGHGKEWKKIARKLDIVPRETSHYTERIAATMRRKK